MSSRVAMEKVAYILGVAGRPLTRDEINAAFGQVKPEHITNTLRALVEEGRVTFTGGPNKRLYALTRRKQA